MMVSGPRSKDVAGWRRVLGRRVARRHNDAPGGSGRGAAGFGPRWPNRLPSRTRRPERAGLAGVACRRDVVRASPTRVEGISVRVSGHIPYFSRRPGRHDAVPRRRRGPVALHAGFGPTRRPERRPARIRRAHHLGAVLADIAPPTHPVGRRLSTGVREGGVDGAGTGPRGADGLVQGRQLSGARRRGHRTPPAGSPAHRRHPPGPCTQPVRHRTSTGYLQRRQRTRARRGGTTTAELSTSRAAFRAPLVRSCDTPSSDTTPMLSPRHLRGAGPSSPRGAGRRVSR